MPLESIGAVQQKGEKYWVVALMCALIKKHSACRRLTYRIHCHGSEWYRETAVNIRNVLTVQLTLFKQVVLILRLKWRVCLWRQTFENVIYRCTVRHSRRYCSFRYCSFRYCSLRHCFRASVRCGTANWIWSKLMWQRAVRCGRWGTTRLNC